MLRQGSWGLGQMDSPSQVKRSRCRRWNPAQCTTAAPYASMAPGANGKIGRSVPPPVMVEHLGCEMLGICTCQEKGVQYSGGNLKGKVFG